MEHDPTDLVGQRDAAEARTATAKQHEAIERDDLIWLMGTKRGRRIVARVLADGGPNRTSFSTNALQMAFSEGVRNYALKLTANLVKHTFDTYLQMLKEQADG